MLGRYDTSSLKVVASSGSPIPGAAVVKFMDTFGDVLYNFYGSTEVSWATIADPTDLRVAPTTAGRPPLGTRVAILDHKGDPLPIGAVGRIFVGNDMLFDGYTNAQSPAIADQLMDTGDLTGNVVDTRGIDRIAARADLEQHLLDRHTVSILCSGFNDAPSQPVQLTSVRRETSTK